MGNEFLKGLFSYSFQDYFTLTLTLENVVGHFGYSHQRTQLDLKKAEIDQSCLAEARLGFEETLPHIGFETESARREFLTAPVLRDVVRATSCELKVDYAVWISEQLRGTMDFVLEAQDKHQRLIVVQAKKGDMHNAFTQLSVKLIALDHQLGDHGATQVFGAVTTGGLWQLAVLNRAEKRIQQDLNTYRIPADLEDLEQILIGMIKT